ncbi:MAG: NepR family anti-sigma factor [Defluviicoccus sp.]
MQIAAMHFPHALSFSMISTAAEGAIVARNKKKTAGRHGREAGGKRPFDDHVSAYTSVVSHPPTGPAFDRWLHEKLEALYGSVVDEPIPDELLKILGSFQQGKKD